VCLAVAGSEFPAFHVDTEFVNCHTVMTDELIYVIMNVD